MNVIVLDTETANTLEDDKGKLDLSNSLTYDVGWCVLNLETGEVKRTRSFMVWDMFHHKKELMKSAYFAEKIPQYWTEFFSGNRKLRNFKKIKKQLERDMRDYDTNIVCAHNTYFDLNALNTTLRYITSSKQRYFFPYETEFWDTMRMAGDTFCKDKDYIKYCYDNGYITANNQVRKTAEILYRYITNNEAFEESHTGLEDVLIEKEILLACENMGVPMRRKLFKDRPLTTTANDDIIIIESEG